MKKDIPHYDRHLYSFTCEILLFMTFDLLIHFFFLQVKKKKGKMNEESGDQEKGDTSASPSTEIAPTADTTKEAENETETQSEEQSLVENEAKETEPDAEEVAGKAAESVDVDEAKSPAKSTQAVEQMEVDAGRPVKSTSPEPVPSSSSAADDPLASKLAKVVKTGSESPADANSSLVTPETAQKDENTPALSTENLISMLEGSVDQEPSDVAQDTEPMPDSQPQVAAAESEPQVSTSASQSVPESKPQQSMTDLPPPKMNRKYIYKLKSKTGKVLKYVSSVPIVLKRPVISLTKMVEEEEEEDNDDETKNEVAGKAARTEADDVDSDNSTKENNVKANDASKGVIGPRIARKRGRPPLLQKAPVITLDDSPSPDPVADSKEPFKSAAGGSGGSTPSYGVQTRKRQLKFLPDGRVVTPAGKKYKSAAAATAAAVAAAASSSKAVARDENQSSDTDVLTESDDGSQSDRKTKKLPAAAKKFTPLDRKVGEKKGPSKKVFDYDSYFREKSATLTEAKDAKQVATAKKVAETPKSTPAKTPNPPRNNASTPVTSKAAFTPTNNLSAGTSTPASASTSKNAVDPAQLLSSLIGVSIFPHQLNVVKFKPKVIQDRKTMSAQKNVTFVDETSNKKSAASSQPLQQPRNTSFRVSSKPSLQKILPKPVSTPDRFVYLQVRNCDFGQINIIGVWSFHPQRFIFTKGVCFKILF